MFYFNVEDLQGGLKLEKKTPNNNNNVTKHTYLYFKSVFCFQFVFCFFQMTKESSLFSGVK